MVIVLVTVTVAAGAHVLAGVTGATGVIGWTGATGVAVEVGEV